MASWTFAVRALQSRNYRLFFGGQSLSLIGTWMTRVAIAWLVYRLTDSAVLLGIVSFAGQIPSFVLAPLAGVWLDRWDRHRTLLWTQVLSMIQSLLLAVLTLTGAITIWHIIVLALAQGLINAFDMPARQAFVVEMVDRREDLSNAIALNSSMVNGARLVGPSVAGMVIAAFGEGYCFLIDGVSYLAVIASLAAMKVRPAGNSKPARRVVEELTEGWQYVARSVPIRSILLLLAILSIAGMPYTVLMPIFASDILKGGAHTLGFLMGAAGLGALAGAISLAMRRSILGLGKRIILMSGLFGGSLILFAVSKSLWFSLGILVATGFGMMQQMAASNTILQTIVEDEKRGRVMAYYSMAVMGVMPLGSLIAGLLAERFGAPATIVSGGAICLAASLWFARELPAIRELVRPRYQELGILPEIAQGLKEASVFQTPGER